jgi:anaerobic selenocysteine-containing dehydrogenase
MRWISRFATGRSVGVRGRGDDRVNRGRLGPKDLFGWQANGSPDRLTTPLVRRDGELVESDWDTAMDLVAGKVRGLVETRGPSSIGFYTTGQLFLEEYYTLGLIAHGGIGTSHVDGNTRLCTATAAAALKESFGCDGQPGSHTDVDHADVIALYGHNMAETQTVGGAGSWTGSPARARHGSSASTHDAPRWRRPRPSTSRRDPEPMSC